MTDPTSAAPWAFERDELVGVATLIHDACPCGATMTGGARHGDGAAGAQSRIGGELLVR